MTSAEVITIVAMTFGIMAVLLLIHSVQGPPPKDPPKVAD